MITITAPETTASSRGNYLVLIKIKQVILEEIIQKSKMNLNLNIEPSARTTAITYTPSVAMNQTHYWLMAHVCLYKVKPKSES